jgi:hypothetical protein
MCWAGGSAEVADSPLAQKTRRGTIILRAIPPISCQPCYSDSMSPTSTLPFGINGILRRFKYISKYKTSAPAAQGTYYFSIKKKLFG